MKKTKLLTSIAALVLVLSLGACNQPEENTTSEGGGTETTTEENTSEDSTSETNTEENTSEESSGGETTSDGTLDASTKGEKIVEWLDANIDFSSTVNDWDGFSYTSGYTETVSPLFNEETLGSLLGVEPVNQNETDYVLGKKNGYTYGYYEYINTSYSVYTPRTFFADGDEYMVTGYGDTFKLTTTKDDYGIEETEGNYEFYTNRLVNWCFYDFRNMFGSGKSWETASYYDNYETDGATLSGEYNELSDGSKECSITFTYDYNHVTFVDVESLEASGIKEDWDNLFYTIIVKIVADKDGQVTGLYYTKHYDADSFYTDSETNEYLGYTERTDLDQLYLVDPETIEEPDWFKENKDRFNKTAGAQVQDAIGEVNINTSIWDAVKYTKSVDEYLLTFNEGVLQTREEGQITSSKEELTIGLKDGYTYGYGSNLKSSGTEIFIDSGTLYTKSGDNITQSTIETEGTEGSEYQKAISSFVNSQSIIGSELSTGLGTSIWNSYDDYTLDENGKLLDDVVTIETNDAGNRVITASLPTDNSYSKYAGYCPDDFENIEEIKDYDIFVFEVNSDNNLVSFTFTTDYRWDSVKTSGQWVDNVYEEHLVSTKEIVTTYRIEPTDINDISVPEWISELG